MYTTLFLLTKDYPFGQGESFLSNELDLVAARFDRVFLLAVSTKRKAAQTAALPPNVTVRRRVEYFGPAKRVLYGLYGLFAGVFDRRMRAEVRAQHGLVPKLAVCYSYAKIKKVTAWCCKQLESIPLLPTENVVLYSYWFMDTAHAAIALKETLRPQVRRVLAVSRAHGYDVYPNRNPAGVIPFREACLRDIDLLFPCSAAGTAFLCAQFPQYKHKIHTAYLGTRDFGAGPVREDGCFRILTCSALSALKRPCLLAQAIALLEHGQQKRIIWYCIGDGPERPALEAFAASHLHNNELRCLGVQSNAAVMQFYQDMPLDLFVNVSTSEGLPVSIMEALSFGVPAMATDVGGNREIVKPGKNGLLLSADPSPQAVAEGIRHFLEMDPSACMALRAGARATWQASFYRNTAYGAFSDAIFAALKEEQA